MFISIKNSITLILLAVTNMSFSVDNVMAAPHDFDDLPPGNVYMVGDVNKSQGVPFSAECFYWFGAAGPFCGGMSMVVPPPTSPRDCPEMGEQTMMHNNINHVFAYEGSSVGPIKEPWYPFVYWGGNVNFSVDGTLHNYKDILDADGVMMGDCRVSLEKLVHFGTNGASNSCGYFILNDCKVEKFMVGGQELLWDGAY